MAGADQSANEPELELSREKTLPAVGDRQKQLIYCGAAPPKPDCVARWPTRKDENERKSAVPTALRRQGGRLALQGGESARLLCGAGSPRVHPRLERSPRLVAAVSRARAGGSVTRAPHVGATAGSGAFGGALHALVFAAPCRRVVYAFATKVCGRRARLWPSVLRELQRALAVLPLVRSDLARPLCAPSCTQGRYRTLSWRRSVGGFAAS